MEIPDSSLDEYDIISSDMSSASINMNGHGAIQLEIKVPQVPDFEILKDQPRYVISKGKDYSSSIVNKKKVKRQR